MATLKLVEIELDEARRFADLAGILHDFEQARRYAQRLIPILDSPREDKELSESLTISMIVSYARAFASGVRSQFDHEFLDHLTAEQKEVHDQFIHWRNKHISHSVNSFEFNRPVARYVAETVLTDGIQYLGVRSERLIAPSIAEALVFIALLEHQLSIARALYDEEHARLLAIVRSQPVEQILRGPSRVRKLGDQPIHKVRSR